VDQSGIPLSVQALSLCGGRIPSEQPFPSSTAPIPEQLASQAAPHARSSHERSGSCARGSGETASPGLHVRTDSKASVAGGPLPLPERAIAPYACRGHRWTCPPGAERRLPPQQRRCRGGSSGRPVLQLSAPGCGQRSSQKRWAMASASQAGGTARGPRLDAEGLVGECLSQIFLQICTGGPFKKAGTEVGVDGDDLRPILRPKVGEELVPEKHVACGLVTKTKKVAPGHQGAILVAHLDHQVHEKLHALVIADNAPDPLVVG